MVYPLFFKRTENIRENRLRTLNMARQFFCFISSGICLQTKKITFSLFFFSFKNHNNFAWIKQFFNLFIRVPQKLNSFVNTIHSEKAKYYQILPLQICYIKVEQQKVGEWDHDLWMLHSKLYKLRQSLLVQGITLWLFLNFSREVVL